MLVHFAMASALWAAAFPTSPVGHIPSTGPGWAWTDVASSAAEPKSSGERLAWLIWGRRGAGGKVAPGAVTWPQGLRWDTEGTDVSKWGRVVLGEAETTSGALPAPRAETAAITNGSLSDGEWDWSAARSVETPVGPLVVAAQHISEGLQVCVMLPAVNLVSADTQVLLAAAKPTGEQALGLALQWDPRQKISRASQGTLHAGKWAWRRPDREGAGKPSASGAVSPYGDGAWQFLTAEATFSREALGLSEHDGTAHLAVVVRKVPSTQWGDDAIYWPGAHGPATEASECMLCENPDGWGRTRPGSAQARRREIPLPDLPAAPRIDGAIEESEWAGATELSNDFLGVARCPLWVGLHDGALLLAASCQLPRPGLR
ncbi:MAG: hypothetical protein N2512_00655, partial [Armatimonadetes bacterium]|nr:hypothetical protein [Armatimonadota bacterium]